MRGLAAVVMLQGHVFHSFTAPVWREGSVYVLSQFLGGMPPALFLFLTGVTFAFLMDSCERKGMKPWRRVTAALRRAGYLLVLAYLFRFQLFLFGQPSSPWTDLLKVDILNCMGLTLGLLSAMALFSTADRARLCALAGIAIAVLSPLATLFPWEGMPAIVKSYFAPDYDSFSFFPWAAFAAFGMSVGSLIRLVSDEHTERMMHWAAVAGVALVMTARFFGDIPYSIYAKSDFWLDSPALVFIKTGVILLGMAVAWAWNQFAVKGNWSWLRQMGGTSLLIYWVHIELVYGRWLWMWKENLAVPQTTVLAAVTVLLMLLLSVARTRWSQIREWVPGLAARPVQSGD